LEVQKFAALRNKHVGLITNHTGLDSEGRSIAELISHAPGVHLVALFSPEHGLAGRNDEKIASKKDAQTGLPIFSLYGETMRPTDEMLRGIDALVFDVQDAGVRFYTYTTTMAYCMEEAAKRKIAFYVLDRPNPMGGKRCRRADAGRGQDCLYGLLSIAGALWPYYRRVGAVFQRRESHQLRFACNSDEELAPKLFFREHRRALDSALAKPAHFEGRGPIPRD